MFDAAGDTTAAYVLTEPGPVRQMAVGINNTSNVDIFAIGLDDQVWLQHWHGQGMPASNYILMASGRVTAVGVSR